MLRLYFPKKITEDGNPDIWPSTQHTSFTKCPYRIVRTHCAPIASKQMGEQEKPSADLTKEGKTIEKIVKQVMKGLSWHLK